MLTISRLSRWSINYYNDTAREARQAGGGSAAANGGLGVLLRGRYPGADVADCRRRRPYG